MNVCISITEYKEDLQIAISTLRGAANDGFKWLEDENESIYFDGN